MKDDFKRANRYNDTHALPEDYFEPDEIICDDCEQPIDSCICDQICNDCGEIDCGCDMMEIEDEIDQEARAKIKNLQEGTRDWEIEYAKAMSQVKKRRGLQ